MHVERSRTDGGKGGIMLCLSEKEETFRTFLVKQEKSAATIEKYLRDAELFFRFCAEQGENHRSLERHGTDRLTQHPELSRELVLAFKRYLQGRYRPNSVNSILNALNCYLKYAGHPEFCVRMLKQQRQLFCDEKRLLKQQDYRKLVEQAEREGKTRLSCILQTLGMTGIRIGELRFIQCKCLDNHMIHIEHKGKIRDIVLPKDLVSLLRTYCRQQGIKEGPVFITRYGNPVDRKNIWKEMKQLCRRAGVLESKVFPHNFRHLFAVAFYERKKDIVRLADYLGHSSLETTRRYTMISSLQACQRELELGLLISGTVCTADRRCRPKTRFAKKMKRKKNVVTGLL